MAKSANEDSQRVFQLKVTLRGIRPPIWRRIQVTDDITLSRLHDILQTVMGWWEEHLHAFNVNGVEYGSPDPYSELRSDRRIKLGQLGLAEKSKFRYEYDFGDSWEHELLVEKILAPEPGVSYPRCLKGKRACPPEDVGGIWGYMGYLEAIEDPAHPQHDELLEWSGPFDPEAFDLEEVNGALSGER